nr:hypothetical protein [Kibdelosporangium sp. MJ126-NF4]CTQ88144.1 hypothetical protein [Kibdelosporangium sp. MJ126-NF4]
MPQQRHDLGGVRAVLGQPSRERVPQRVQVRARRHLVTDARPPVAGLHQVVQSAPADRPAPIVQQQSRVRPEPLLREPHGARRQVRVDHPFQRRLDRDRPLPASLALHVKALLTGPADHRTPLQRPNFRRPQTRDQAERDHQHVSFRPRITRLARPGGRGGDEPLGRVLTAQGLGGEGRGLRPDDRAHRIAVQQTVRHTEVQELVPGRPRAGDGRLGVTVGELTERCSERGDSQVPQAELLDGPTSGVGQQGGDAVEIAAIGGGGVRRILAGSPGEKERVQGVEQQHVILIPVTTDNPHFATC